MSRCKVCDIVYFHNYDSKLPGEDYCPECEGVISKIIEEAEEPEEMLALEEYLEAMEEEDDEDTPALPD